MSIGFVFWLFMLLWLVFSLYWGYRADRSAGFPAVAPIGVNFVIYVLLFLLGWKTFGFPIQGSGP